MSYQMLNAESIRFLISKCIFQQGGWPLDVFDEEASILPYYRIVLPSIHTKYISN